jgi:hypothetical protein
VSNRTFFYWLIRNHFLLPTFKYRWCTKNLKVTPFNQLFEEGDIVSVGIRADETKRISKYKNKYERSYELIDAGYGKKEVIELCNKYNFLSPLYSWRSHCSCFCCPYQSINDWIALMHNYPNLFELSEQWEKLSCNYLDRRRAPFYWLRNTSLMNIRKSETAQLKLGI